MSCEDLILRVLKTTVEELCIIELKDFMDILEKSKTD